MAKAVRQRGISRIDQEERRTHGWYVRVRLKSGSVASKLFSDRSHGSKEKAMKAAIAYRDSLGSKAAAPKVAAPKAAAKKAAKKPAKKAAKKTAKKAAKRGRR